MNRASNGDDRAAPFVGPTTSRRGRPGYPDSASGNAGGEAISVRLTAGAGDLAARLADAEHAGPVAHPDHDPRWPLVLADAFGHVPYLLEAERNGRSVGTLALCLVAGPVFGRFLVSLPFLNSGGVTTEDDDVAAALVDRAADLAAELNCKHLELRHERRVRSPRLGATVETKVHMRMGLPGDAETLWKGLKAKVRNQVRKGQSQGFDVAWGGAERVDDFYAVFCRNMRDLGTPVFPRRLFATIAERFPDEAEFCVVRDGTRPVAAGLLLHGETVTEVPCASALRSENRRNPNMLMYWHLLERAVARGATTFDFGRCTKDGPTHSFKKQWGAQPSPAVWQYHVREGEVGTVRKESGKFALMIGAWRRLPLPVANRLGPLIVRGIP